MNVKELKKHIGKYKALDCELQGFSSLVTGTILSVGKVVCLDIHDTGQIIKIPVNKIFYVKEPELELI